jgi:hypothetical protein
MQRAAAALEQALMSLQTDLADDQSVRVNPDAASPAAEKGPEPARATLLQVGFGFAAAQSLSVVAELGIADLLSAGPQTIEALAMATRTDRAASTITVPTVAAPIPPSPPISVTSSMTSLAAWEPAPSSTTLSNASKPNSIGKDSPRYLSQSHQPVLNFTNKYA